VRTVEKGGLTKRVIGMQERNNESIYKSNKKLSLIETHIKETLVARTELEKSIIKLRNSHEAKKNLIRG
jgi:hypothetical protein